MARYKVVRVKAESQSLDRLLYCKACKQPLAGPTPRVFDGVTRGAVITANAVPTSRSVDVCWYWSNSSKTRGYWDFCQ